VEFRPQYRQWRTFATGTNTGRSIALHIAVAHSLCCYAEIHHRKRGKNRYCRI